MRVWYGWRDRLSRSRTEFGAQPTAGAAAIVEIRLLDKDAIFEPLGCELDSLRLCERQCLDKVRNNPSLARVLVTG